MMTSLNDLLKLPRFSDIKLITPGVARLDMTIKSVEITETPDIEHYVTEDCFLLTTAMVYKNKQEKLLPLIDSLIRSKAVGLGIKVGRFLGSLDEQVIAYAEKVDFPLLVIPDSYSLGSLLHQFLDIVWGTRHEELSFALDIQKSFSDLLIQDAPNKIVIDHFSKLVKTPVILLNPYWNILTHSIHFNDSNNRADYYTHQIYDLLNISDKKEGSFLIQDTNHKDLHVSLVPIRVYSNFPHYLVILNPEHIPYPISNFAIEQASMVLSYILFKNERVADSKYAQEADFYKELIDYSAQNQHKAPDRLMNAKFGYIKSNYYQIAHVYDSAALKLSKLTPYGEELLLMASRWLRQHIKNYFPDGLVFYFYQTKEIILMIQAKPPQLDEVLLKIRDDIADFLPLQLIFSVGNAYPNLGQIDQSHTQAHLVFDERKTQQLTDPIISYENKGMFHLFNHLEHNDVRFFCQTVLQELAYPEDASLTELRKTLHVYLDSQCEIARTASALFVHRNTVKYRIQRVEEILGLAVNSPENSLNLRIALELSDENK